MKTVALYSIKGGVGKTAAAVNLAFEASRGGSRVLLWDLDPQGAATFYFRLKPLVRGGAERLVSDKGDLASHLRATDHTGLHAIPADFSLRHLDLHLDDHKRPTGRLATLLEPLSEHYDVVFIDCAPGITLTSESVFAAADLLLVPTIPTTLSTRTLDQLHAFLDGRPSSPRVLAFASIVDRRKKLQRDLAAELLVGAAGFLHTAIPNATVVEQMGIERSPVALFAPASPAARAFRELWVEVAAELWG